MGSRQGFHGYTRDYIRDTFYDDIDDLQTPDLDVDLDTREPAESAELLDALEHGGAARRLIFVTNRGPVEHTLDPSGAPVAHRGAGGVVSGLLCAAEDRPVSWISLAMTPADRVVAERLGDHAIAPPAGLDQLCSRLVSVPEDAYHRYYEGFSNRALWFAQHGLCRSHGFALPDAATLHADWNHGYTAVNRAVAEAVVAELATAGTATPVMFHDYHLYLAPALVRRQMPDASLLHFIHIPWPALDDWEGMPGDMLRAIYEGLAANDVVGFQTARDVRNFVSGVHRHLPGATLSADGTLVRWRGHTTRLRVYPIAVTPASVEAAAADDEARAEAERTLRALRRAAGHKIILRVDRIEPTKNIVLGFEAYERLLADHPEWRGRVTFLALLVPSREGLPEYRAYSARVHAAIDRINAAYGVPGWQPIVALIGNDHSRALACMRDYDVLLVNPLIDGMNLVVKEGGLLNQRDGVIVLSRRAGAYAQLHGGVLGIAPTDLDATARALHRALTMPLEERADLAAHVRGILHAEDATSWLNQQLRDLLDPFVPSHLPAAAPSTVTIGPARPSVWRLDDLKRRARAAVSDQGLIPAPPLLPLPSLPSMPRFGARDRDTTRRPEAPPTVPVLSLGLPPEDDPSQSEL